jgi:uncharacterized protein YjbI with pentapeptide repeats
VFGHAESCISASSAPSCSKFKSSPMHTNLYCPRRVLQIATMFLLVAFAGSARADIFQWEYINPADPGQGRQQSATLAPDGAGVDAVPGAYLANRNLTMAYLIGADLAAATIYDANLTNADLSQANFTSARLARTDFTGAEVRGANFFRNFSYYTGGTGITLAQLYSTASYEVRDLTGIGLAENDLSGANFAGQNFTDANFGNASLTGADFADTDVRGANFVNYVGTGITLAQLYSTASYSAHDLTGIGLPSANLSGANFAGQNFTNANFESATLTDADFTGAAVRGADFSKNDGTGISLAQLYSTSSYQAHDLTGIGLFGNDLSGWNFAGQNLTNANFSGATLTEADFRKANLANAGLAAMLTNANFSESNLTNANFSSADLTGANFRQANLANTKFYTINIYDPGSCSPFGGICDPCTYFCYPSYFYVSSVLTDADVTAADARGAAVLDISDATTTNLIWPDGHISGLDLDAGGLLVVRDYDGNPTRTDAFNGTPAPLPPIPITIDEHLAMAPGGTLRMVFEADAWDSTISFAPGIPVTLGGTLELTFATDVNLASQIGRTFGLFDWTGVTPTGAFAVSSPYRWNLSNLYTTGEVTLTAISEPSALVLLLFAAATLFVARRTRLCAGLLTAHRSSTAGLLISTFTALLLCCSTALLISPSPARADIYQWEYINPADPSQGKQQSTTLAPDVAGVDAVPGPNLSDRNLTMAYLIGADLYNADFRGANLTGASFREADLANADFRLFQCIGANCYPKFTTLTDADFSGAEVRGAEFTYARITLAQLYSTASYKVHDLTGIGLGSTELSGGNFVGQNLTDANLDFASLTNADFTDAEVRGASFGRDWFWGGTGITPMQLYSTASYQAGDLSGINFGDNDLTGGNFAGHNLTGANFSYATLTGTDFTDAEVRYAHFGLSRGCGGPDLIYCVPVGTGITLLQLYSTASYQAYDLTGIGLWGNYLAGGKFVGQSLTNANFDDATLTDADLTGADARGAHFYYDYPYAVPAGAIISNLIRPDGHINGLDLDAGGLLVVRDYDGDPSDFYRDPVPPIPITVDQHLAMGLGGTLRMVFEADGWDSTISFAPGIPVTLGGTLELTFANNVDSATQVGRTFHIFNWTGVSPTGAFAISSPYAWDLSNLYTTGEVTLTAVPEPRALLMFSVTLALPVAMGRLRLFFSNSGKGQNQ